MTCSASLPFLRRHARRAAIVVLVAFAAFVLPADLGAQTRDDLRPLLDRIQRLERDIQTLNVQLARGATAPAPAAPRGAPGAPAATGASAEYSLSRLDVRVTALEEELRNMTGTIEGINHQLQQLTQRLDKLVGDIDFRLSALEKGGPRAAAGGEPGAPAASAAPAPPPVEAGKPGTLGTLKQEDLAARPTPAPGREASASKAAGVLPEGTAKDQYNHAFGLLRQANYDQAETAFKEFLAKHPDDPLAGNARYWLGETHYVRTEYLKAAEIFAENYKVDPKGQKAPDTLLKLAMSLGRLDKKQQACLTLDELRKRFPDTTPAIKNAAGVERKRLACR
jgi:tol-pal system protein YbgF